MNNPPKPAPFPSLMANEATKSVFPEASLLFLNRHYGTNRSKHSATNWAYGNTSSRSNQSNKENVEDSLLEIQNSLQRKQVRFENRAEAAAVPVTTNYFALSTYKDNPQPFKPVDEKKVLKSSNDDTKTKRQFTCPESFDKIYLSRVPNNKLDLSMLEYKKADKLEKEPYKRDSEKRYCQSLKPFVPEEKSVALVPTKSDCCCRNEHSNTNLENTVSDLLKIIKEQNEQLRGLQSQVEYLIKANKEEKKVTECKEVWTSSHERFVKRGTDKMSVGLMTSFEVSIKSKKDMFDNRKNMFEPKRNNVEQIRDVIVEEDDDKGSDCSLRIEEPVQVHEPPSSPVASIHVDMQEYDSDTSGEGEASNNSGMTFYNNVLKQVNDVLGKCKEPVAEETDSNWVREATLRHLQRIGIKLPKDMLMPAGQPSKPTPLDLRSKQKLPKFVRPPDDFSKVLDLTALKTQPKLL